VTLKSISVECLSVHSAVHHISKRIAIIVTIEAIIKLHKKMYFGLDRFIS